MSVHQAIELYSTGLYTSPVTGFLRYRLPSALNGSILRGYEVICDSGPVGSDAIFDLNLNGTSVHGSPSDRLKIVSGQTAGLVTGLNVALASRDALSIDLDSTPNSIGNDIALILNIDEPLSSVSTYLDFAENTSAPSAPGSGFIRLYGINDKHIWTRDSTGLQVDLSASGSGDWKAKTKAIDTCRNTTTTLANDNELFFTMNANKTYAIDLLVWGFVQTTPGFKYALSGPASPTLVRIYRESSIFGGAFAGAYETAYTTAQVIAGNNNFLLRMNISVKTSVGNGGTFAFQWAQNVSNASSVCVSPGSYMRYMEV